MWVICELSSGKVIGNLSWFRYFFWLYQKLHNCSITYWHTKQPIYTIFCHLPEYNDIPEKNIFDGELVSNWQETERNYINQTKDASNNVGTIYITALFDRFQNHFQVIM
jgi:hypothetical protein